MLLDHDSDQYKPLAHMVSVLQPFGAWKTAGRKVNQAGIAAIRDTLDAGYIPVLHGDCALDSEQHCCILSGDVIIEVRCWAFTRCGKGSGGISHCHALIVIVGLCLVGRGSVLSISRADVDATPSSTALILK